MKKVIILSLALALVGGVAYANFCARDVVPAATLLFPYVTVDMTAAGAPDVNGQTTITGITNVSRAAQIVHFTAWDALSNPRIDFDEVLSGYDVLQINWRDFLGGRFDLFDTALTAFTATSPLTLDPFEWGPDGRGQPTSGATLTTAEQRNVARITGVCSTVPPYGNRSDLSATIISLMSEVLIAYPHAGCGTARTLRGDKTAWAPAGTNPLFFYVTADVVNACNLQFPNEDTYWTAPIATTSNVLVGDVIYLKAATNYSEMFSAVHIEALSGYTGPAFYGEKTTTATPNREPLATAFAFRYANDPLAGITSNVLLWKSRAEVFDDEVDDCGSYMYYAWDNDERSLSTTTQPISGLPTGGLDPNQFPLETQKVPLTTAYFDLPASYGWMLIILPPSYVNTTPWADPTTTTDATGYFGDDYYYGWAGLQFVYGTYSAGVEAATMASYWCNSSQQLPELGANPGFAYNQWGVFYPYLP